MESSLNRRQFLRNSAVIGAGLAAYGVATPLRANTGANGKLVVAVMGLGRGLGLMNGALSLPNVEVAYVCDIDTRRVDRAVEIARDRQGTAPKGVTDFRTILDDDAVDALFIATTNHWHAPATIMACAAGKHVYVEKPGSHNPREGEMMVAAARKYDRVVQMGNQRRSWPGIIEGIEKVRGGAIGRVTFARCWYNNARGSIGHGQPASVPEEIDYSLWQGPAPERPYKDNLVHYNWHWHWHWGNGEIGNNGIHTLDLARWGLGVEYPSRVSYTGGRYHFDDDWETPDTGVATFHFGDKGASWEGSSCHPRRAEEVGLTTFYGTEGTLALVGGGYKVFDLQGRETENVSGPGGDAGHIADFFDAIRNGKTPNSEIAEGQKSTLLCHLGNIAYRTGQTLHCDPETGKVIDSPEAEGLWSREYRAGWKPSV